LSTEAQNFARGDFSSPARIHGADMPGLKALTNGYSRVQLAYREMPAGAEIRYTTQSPELVRAIHAWFEAQLSDHGSHAARH
jgi:hypothetical protein